MHRATSVNGISVRLTDERWLHITEEHCELAGLLHDVLDAIAAPEKVLGGNEGELLAVKETGGGKRLVVVYKEDIESEDGFVITAFVTRRFKSLERRPVVWPLQDR